MMAATAKIAVSNPLETMTRDIVVSTHRHATHAPTYVA